MSWETGVRFYRLCKTFGPGEARRENRPDRGSGPPGWENTGCSRMESPEPVRTSRPDPGHFHTGSGILPSLFCSSPDVCDAFQGGGER